MSLVFIILCITLIILVIYVRTYYNYPPKAGLIQTSLSMFTWDQLLKRQPIVIEDSVQDVGALNNAWFDGKTAPVALPPNDDSWHTNQFKYMIFYAVNPEQKTEVMITGPRTNLASEDANIIAVQLAPYQILLLPLHWKFLLQSSEDLWVFGYHDYITRFLPKLKN